MMPSPHTTPARATDRRTAPKDRVLLSGDHLLEVGFARAASVDVVYDALERMGFSDAILDQSLRSPSDDLPSEWGDGSDESEGRARIVPAHRVRFVGRLTRGVRLLTTPSVSWLYARRVALDPFEPPNLDHIRAARLEHGRTYEAVVASRIRAQPTRASMSAALGKIGLEPQKLCCLRRNRRGPAQSEAHHWYVLGTWKGPDSYVTGNESVYLDRVASALAATSSATTRGREP